jgi:hypothetical protein
VNAISAKLRASVDGNGRRGLTYWCQGCECLHQVWVEGGEPGRNWGWNGDVEKPVFTPSVLVTYPANPDADEQFKEWRTARRCHTFVGCNGAQPGEVIFLGDCTHAMAGQTLPLPDLPDHLRGSK